MIIFTESLERQMTPDLERRIQRAVFEFPELVDRKVIVGTCRNKSVHGEADAGNFMIGLNLRRRGGPSYYTIGHELTHLLQPEGLRLIPSGEVQCDIWTLARSPLFLDQRPSYLRVPCRAETWQQIAADIRTLCVEAIAVRRTHRNYVVWLESRIREMFRAAAPRPPAANGQEQHAGRP